MPIAPLAHLSPVVAIHLALAVTALLLGPLALRARKGSRLHRASGYAWVTLMAGAAVSSAFIRDFRMPNLMGFTPIHALTVATLVGLALALWHVARGRIAQHRRTMWGVYVGGCLVAGSFAFLPNRVLGQWLWQQQLGLA